MVVMSRTNEELKKAYEHVKYEIDTLDSAFRFLQLGQNNLGYVLNNLALESFLIHVRLLVDFLYQTERNGHQKEDIIASDFFTSSNEWKSIIKDKPALLTNTKDRADKMLAHLSYLRDEYKSEPWQYEAIYRVLRNKIELFTNNVPNEIKT
jgi:hypothetical protein